MKDKCIVLEGGGLRCAFTAGILDFLLENDFSFDRIIGASAGACAGASYASKQIRRNYAVNVVYPSNKDYMGIGKLLTGSSYFNMDFIFREIPENIYPFDSEALIKNPVEFDIVVTSLETGKGEVLTKKDIKKYGVLPCLQASSSIPFMSKPVNIDGRVYYDGGVADSIPVSYALTKHKKAVVVLTRPEGYRKQNSKFPGLIKFFFRKHPQFANTLINRSKDYNESLDLCAELREKGKLFIIAPDGKYKIGRTEKDIMVRDRLYRHGYELMEQEFSGMKKFLK
ncbi:MAG: patatin family protein [Spirochaetia bacterium]|jgi:predicted patatin/cPLA2 family phospholipase|nr:patatin family protein [Spirochaetia bacterium]